VDCAGVIGRPRHRPARVIHFRQVVRLPALHFSPLLPAIVPGFLFQGTRHGRLLHILLLRAPCPFRSERGPRTRIAKQSSNAMASPRFRGGDRSPTIRAASRRVAKTKTPTSPARPGTQSHHDSPPAHRRR
jgi:hypothetical protein